MIVSEGVVSEWVKFINITAYKDHLVFPILITSHDIQDTREANYIPQLHRR